MPETRRDFLKAVGVALAAPGFVRRVEGGPGVSGEPFAEQGTPLVPRFKSFDECFRRPWGRFFWIERQAGKYHMGDPVSHFNGNLDFKHLTFDIGNNRALANVGIQGEIKKVTVYRDAYWGNCYLPGVWTEKDTSCFGPYAYVVEIGGQVYDLAKVDWDLRTGLLDNIFPISELRDPAGRFIVRLVTYSPLSADGSQRLGGVIYGLHLENISESKLEGTVLLPKPFGDGRDDLSEFEKNEMLMHQFDPCEFEMRLGDAKDPFQRVVSFDLERGKCVWVPTIIYMPNDPGFREVNERGTLYWLSESWRYYRRLMGRLEMSGDEYLPELFERQLMGALLSIGVSGGGKITGTNWGSYPVTRLIWTKDAYYACLPITLRDPLMAQKIILWFGEYGVRPESFLMSGGVNHSLSISLGSIVLGGLYYEQTGDGRFFIQHPELKKTWDALLQALLASRLEEDVWLFPTQFVSDGKVKCDYHTGSNVVAWRALRDYARLLEEVYGELQRAREYTQIADKVRAAIMDKCVIDGPFGRQFIEGVNRDRKVPRMFSDGEESDTTLAPFYGFSLYDDDIYLNYMHFSMTEHNASYQPKGWAISWGGVPSTAPGYMKGIAHGMDLPSLWGDHGYYSEVRKIADADGSIWWWPYGRRLSGWKYGEPVRGIIGKSGWFAGVHSVVFVSRFLGVSYDAPKQIFRFAPFSPSSNHFSWEDFPMGNDRFSLSYEEAAGAVRTTFKNLTNHPVQIEAVLPIEGVGNSFSVSLNGQPVMTTATTRYLGREAVRVMAEVSVGAAADLVVTPKAE